MSTLQERLASAIAIASAADAAWRDCPHGPDEHCEHRLATDTADAALKDAREALKDAPRDWLLFEEGQQYDTVAASSAAEALDAARAGVARSNYPDCEGTIWIDIRVVCHATGEEGKASVRCDPEEPDCLGGEDHDWQSPIELVGGIEENPGVYGHGGGVIITECCVHCGCKRTTDTWAQRPDTGEQGLESVAYEERFYAEVQS